MTFIYSNRPFYGCESVSWCQTCLTRFFFKKQLKGELVGVARGLKARLSWVVTQQDGSEHTDTLRDRLKTAKCGPSSGIFITEYGKCSVG